MPKNLVTIKDLHVGRIRGLAATYQGEDGLPLLLSGGEDRNLNMSDALSGDFVRKVPAFTGRPGHQGHRDKIYAIQLWTSKEDGVTYIVSTGDDLLIRIFNMEDCKGVRTMGGHSQYVHSLIILQEESRCVSASYDRSIRLWDLLAGEQLRKFSQSKVLYAIDWLMDAPTNTVFATGFAEKVHVWDVGTATVLNILEEGAPVGADDNSLTSSVEGAVVEGGGGDGGGEGATNDPFSALLEEGGRVVRPRDTLPQYVKIELRSHIRTVTAIAFPRSDRLISASDDATICVWNPEDEHCPLLEKINAKTPIYSMKVWDDGTAFLLVTASWGKPFSVKIWNMEAKEKPSDDSESEEELESDEEPEPKEMTYLYALDVGLGHTENVVNLAILDDGKPHVVKEKRKADEEVDTKRVASISFDGTIRTWDLRPAIEIIHRAKFLEAAQTSRTF